MACVVEWVSAGVGTEFGIQPWDGASVAKVFLFGTGVKEGRVVAVDDGLDAT